MFPLRTPTGEQTVVRSRSEFDDDGARPVPYLQVVIPKIYIIEPVPSSHSDNYHCKRSVAMHT